MARAGVFPALFLAQSLAPAAAQPALDMPVDCTLGQDCYIQNYVDTDAGPEWRDFSCGGLSYDGHKGTDFALRSIRAMEAGVDVRAAAAGIVRGLRDGMDDRLYVTEEDARIAGRECGNGVVLQHEDGWQTQYCHMKRGSIAVSNGDRVAAGDKLGQIGLSGRTQFPHLHISVRQGDRVVDPFQPGTAEACGAGGVSLWSDPAIQYVPGGLLTAGFLDAVPVYDAVKAGTAHRDSLPASGPALVIWVYAYGARRDDVIELQIDGPDGRFFETRQTIERNRAQLFRAGGRKLSGQARPGSYSGTAILYRDGVEYDRIGARVTLTP